MSDNKNNKNKGNKKKKNPKKKPQGGYSSNQNNNYNKRKKNTKTLFIGKIYNDGMGNSQVSGVLQQHRIKCLKGVLESYGDVEHFSDNIENQGYVLVTYKTRDMAEYALRKLKNKNENEDIMGRIKEQLRKQKISDTVCPNLTRYRYDWSDKQSKSVKNAYSMKKVTYQSKDTVHKKSSHNQHDKVNGGGSGSGKTDKSGKKTKKKKKPKQKKYKKKEEVDETNNSSSNSNSGKVKKGTSQQQQHKEQQEKVEKKEQKVIDAEDLRREADKAKLKDELSYLATQLQHLEEEISAENKRCRDRDERINKLTEELKRVDLTKNRLERQLSNERRWKKLNQDSLAQLKQELEHLHQEQQSARLRLNQSDSSSTTIDNQSNLFSTFSS